MSKASQILSEITEASPIKQLDRVAEYVAKLLKGEVTRKSGVGLTYPTIKFKYNDEEFIADIKEIPAFPTSK